MPSKSADDLKIYNIQIWPNDGKVSLVFIAPDTTVHGVEIYWHHLSDTERESMKVKCQFIWQTPNSNKREEYPVEVDFSHLMGKV